VTASVFFTGAGLTMLYVYFVLGQFGGRRVADCSKGGAQLNYRVLMSLPLYANFQFAWKVARSAG
jgi:hypothetical protein